MSRSESLAPPHRSASAKSLARFALAGLLLFALPSAANTYGNGLARPVVLPAFDPARPACASDEDWR
jgi:hypothetical protein